jgi:hypothetical protein
MVDVFTSEWSFLHRATGSLTPGTTDRVSTMKAGLIEQLQHAFLTKEASWAFRAALIAFLGALALHDFAPAAITISSVSAAEQSVLLIGNLAGSQQLNLNCTDCSASVGTTIATPDLLSSVLDMEQLFSFTYGFSLSPKDCAVGVPSLTYIENGAPMSYSTDSVCWRHQCQWVEKVTYAYNASFSPSGIGQWSTPTLPGITFVNTSSVVQVSYSEFFGENSL